MRIPIGFKTANPAKTDGIVADFYAPLVGAGIGPVVMSIDAAGHCYDVQRLVEGTPLERTAVMHFRRTGDGHTGGMDVANYDADPVADAERLWAWHISRWPKELRKDLVWTGITNEPRKEASEWLARHAYRLCELALRDGHRLTVFGWAAGTPEPEDWRKPEMTRLLGLLRQHPWQLALGLHEYSYEADTLDSPLIGRWQAIPRPWPSILVLEFGWAYNAAPEAAVGIPQIVEAYRKWYAYPEIKGLGLWTLDKGKGGRDLPNIIHRYMRPLAATIRDTDIPPLGEEPTTTPVEPPAPPVVVPVEKLGNGSFEDGWYHPGDVPELQIPNGWTFKWRDGNDAGWANPIDRSAGARFVRPEVRTLPVEQLPAAERDVFVRDGDYTLKVFKGGGSLYFSLMQTVSGLKAGRAYRLTTPIFPDLVKGYADGRKVWADDPDAGLWRVRVGAVAVTGTPSAGPFGGGWKRLAPGVWNELAAEFQAAGTTADVKVDILLPFPLPQNGIFADGWTLTALTAEPPPPVIPPPAPPPNLPIVDISHHQGLVNWDVLSKKVAGVIIRLGYGVTEDREARRNAAEAIRLNVPFATYHYFVPSVDPVKQAEFYSKLSEEIAPGRRMALDLEETGGVQPIAKHITLLPWRDVDFPDGRFADEVAVEYGGGKRSALEATLISIAELRDRARRYAEAATRSGGRRTLIYTGQWYWGGWLNYPAWGANHDLWIAAWTIVVRPIVPKPWTAWHIWQNTVDEIKRAEWGVQSDRLDIDRYNSAVIPDLRQYLMPDDVPAPAPDTFSTRLWAEATGRPVWAWLPGNALAAAITADGLFPVSNEYRFEHGGRTWVYQIAEGGRRDRRRVYYAELGKWGDVKWIAGPGETPPTPPPPPPVVVTPPAPPIPAAEKIDMLPFIRGDHRRQFDMGYDAGTQNVQVWHLGPRDWLYIKGEAGEYERLGLRVWNGAEWIFRFDDTSETPERFYAHYLSRGGAIGAPWFPRYAEVGRWYETPKFVQHYLKAGCVPQDSDNVTDRLRLMGRPRAVTYAASLGKLAEVVTLEWGAGEQYDFAAGRGCVAFRDARRVFWYIGDVDGRADKTYKRPGCITWELN